MMSCIILYRINGGLARAVLDGDGELAEFADYDKAVAYCSDNLLFQSGQADYQIVELTLL